MAQIFTDNLNGVLLPLAAALAVFLAVYLGMSGYYKMRYPHFPQASQNRHRGLFRKNRTGPHRLRLPLPMGKT
ncbi:MAG TPA: hypothetical protein VM144_09180 [Aestuariivirga sp.]|nr:hypothetical protein [Aestuariivirga sp.]